MGDPPPPPYAPYGSWKSPLTSAIACGSSIALDRIYVDKYNSDKLYWNELHPEEEGRTIVYCKDKNSDANTAATRCTPEGYDVYDMVHEYGGAAFVVDRRRLFFQNLMMDGTDDNKIYLQTQPLQPPKAVTKKSSLYRYADADFTNNKNYMFAVREDHSQVGMEPTNLLVAINVATGEEEVVVYGNSFYTTPRVSPDGSMLTFVTWMHPNMPWDNTEIWVIKISFDQQGKLVMGERTKIAGEVGINFMEPSWTADNKLLYICDKTGWWNLYRVDSFEDPTKIQTTCLHNEAKEIGGPCWNFGNRSYSPNPNNSDQLVMLYGAKPQLLTLSTAKIQDISTDEQDHMTSCVFLADGTTIFFLVDNPSKPTRIMKYDVASGSLTDFHYSAAIDIDDGYISGNPKTYKFDSFNPTLDFCKVKHAYAHYYAPKNKDYVLPNESPPVLIKVHGGPTAAASFAMDLEKQYFTSRGIGILDVDYRGSTGYGTEFRNALKGKWGVYDLNDVVSAINTLVGEKVIDPKKVVMSGASSGGYTTLACFTFKNNVDPPIFAAGASYAGISDLTLLAQHTHKFESRYTDSMVAPYPEDIDTYKARSPIKHKKDFLTPCAFIHGGQDKIVPLEQSKVMFDALVASEEIPCAKVYYKDEYHHFKKLAHREKALNGEFYFYSKMLHFTPADEGISIYIFNLDEEN